jgi:hypothetical protein
MLGYHWRKVNVARFSRNIQVLCRALACLRPSEELGGTATSKLAPFHEKKGRPALGAIIHPAAAFHGWRK